MRILAVTNLYPNPLQPHRATFNRHQLRILHEQHPVRVIAPIAWTDELQAWRRGGVLPANRQVECDGLTVEHPRYWFPPRILRGSYGYCFQASIRRSFQRAVAAFRPDVVFAPWAYPDGWAAVRLAQRAKLPVVIQVHGSDVLLLDHTPARKRPTITALRAADGIVAVSQDIANKLCALGVEPQRVRVIYDGVDPALFHPGPRAASRTRLSLPMDVPVVLFVGNLVPVKAVNFLIDALARLPGVHARLIGAGPLRTVLEQQIRRLRLTERVILTGAIAQSQLPDWYRAADVLALPSYSEGVPNVLLEAAACGTPYVASRVGGIAEIADRGHGRLVPAGDVEQLAEALRATLASERPQPLLPRARLDAVNELATFLVNCQAQYHQRTESVRL